MSLGRGVTLGSGLGSTPQGRVQQSSWMEVFLGPAGVETPARGGVLQEAPPRLVETQLLCTKVNTIYIVVLFLAEGPLYLVN